MKTIIAFIVAVGMMAGSSFAQSKTESGTPPKPQAQEGWYRQKSGSNELLSRVQFFNRTNGWVCKSSGVPAAYRTTNGGQLWMTVFPPEGWSFVYFQNDSTGFAVGNVSRNLRHLIKTTDYGATWSDSVRYEMTDDPPPAFRDMVILGDTMFIVSNSSTGSFSTDGGKSWRWFDTKVIRSANAIYAERNKKAFIVGEDLTISRSYAIGGGISWERLPTEDIGGLNWYDITMLDNGKIIVVGEGTIIGLSEDNGGTWRMLPRTKDSSFANFYSIDFCDTTNGIVVGGYGQIYRTTDGGTTWNEQNSTVRHGQDTTDDVPLYSVCMVDSLYAWATSSGGLILHTNDAGKTWVRQTIDVDTLDVQIKSNPVVSNALSIGYKLPRPSSLRFEVTDMTGRVVSTTVTGVEDAGVHYRQLPLDRCTSGSYILRTQAGSLVSTVKFQIIAP